MTETIRQPRSTEAATALCERFARLDGQIAEIEEERQANIAAVNADADRASTDLIAQRDAIAAKLEPWWAGAGEDLTKGKRKSIELGGCIVGTIDGRATLAVAGKEDETALKLLKLRWGKGLVTVKVALARAVLLKATEGKRAAELAEMGLTRKEGGTTFFVKRAEQGGTRSARS